MTILMVCAVIIMVICAVICLIFAGRKGKHERQEEIAPQQRTRLLTVGGIVYWSSRLWEITRFVVDDENQTVAVLSAKDGFMKAYVSVEELAFVG